MKTMYFLLAAIITSSLFAQSHTFTGNGGSTDWHNPANWSAITVPTSASEVLIPDGFEVNIATSASAQGLTLSGSGTLILEGNLSVSETFSIEDVAVFSFEDGDLSAGTIENNGTMRFLNPEFKTIANTVINNHSRMDFISNNILNLEGTITINNLSDGVMDILANGGLTQANGGTATLINDGLVKKYTENGDFGSFYMILNVINNNTIEVLEESQYLFLTPGVSFHNTSTGILTGTGVFDITSPFLNEGIVSPGGDEIGELRFINTFNLDGGTILIDLDNLDNYDSIRVVGAPEMAGTIEINSSNLTQDNLGEQYDILTSQFTVNGCEFPNDFYIVNGGGETEIYTILCNSNSVTLSFLAILNVNTSIADLNDFSITPNPVRQDAVITLDNNQVNATQVVIYSLTGKKVRTILIDSETTTFNRDSLADGIYFAQLVSEGKVMSTKKIILK